MVKKAKSVCSYKGVWIFTHTHTHLQARREERKRACVVRIIALSILVGWMVGCIPQRFIVAFLFCLWSSDVTNKQVHSFNISFKQQQPKGLIGDCNCHEFEIEYTQTNRQTDIRYKNTPTFNSIVVKTISRYLLSLISKKAIRIGIVGG